MRKLNFENFKEQKGITLVALVVTIVVLLILAGITITYVFSDNGILSRAQTAASEIDVVTSMEEIQTKLLAIQIGNQGTYTNDDVQEVVAEVTGQTKNDIVVGCEETTTKNRKYNRYIRPLGRYNKNERKLCRLLC